MNDKKKIQIYLDEQDIEQIKDFIDKKSFEGTPMFNSISHFCRCAAKRFIKNKGEF